MGIKLDISEDYTSGQIAFDCQSIDDVRKIGDILSIVGFNMRFAHIEIKDKLMKDVNFTYNMSDDCKIGIIAYHAKSDKEKFEIEKKLDDLMLHIKHGNLNEKNSDKNLLDKMVAHVNELENTAANLKSHYNGTEMPQYIKFIVTHITENIAPGLREFISQAKMMEMLKEHE